MELINPRPENIRIAMNNVKKGKWVIPNFQRSFTWSTTQVKELIESVIQNYYIGSILLWECGKNQDPKLAVEPIYGSNLSKDELRKESIILDGQQRLTSLFYAKEAPDKPLRSTKYPYVFFVNLKNIIENEYEDCVIPERKTKIKIKNLLQDSEQQYAEQLFPVSKIDNLYDWLDDYEDYLQKNGASKNDSRGKKKILRNCLQRLREKYQIAVVQLPEEMPLDNVCEIFERINSKGTTLTVFDLLNARLLKDGLELRKKLWTNAKKLELISKFSEKNTKFPVLLLQAISLIRKNGCKRKDLIELKAHDFKEDWEFATKYVDKALKVLTGIRKEALHFGVLNRDYLPYQTMIPVLSVLLKRIDDEWNVPALMNKISKWYWASIFMKNYSESTNTQMAKDLREMLKWFKDDSQPPEVVLSANDNLKVKLENETKKRSAIYRGVMSLIVRKGAKDLISSISPEHSTLHDHHIFPKGKIGDLQLDDNDLINSILNRTLISDKSNLKNNMKQFPSSYLKNVKEEIGETQLIENLKSHFIDEECYKYMLNDEFENFISQRKKIIKLEIKKLIQL